MSCSNCYNNCPEIVSDKCVKYTGIDVPVLGIQNGDSLSYVEQALIEFLTSAIDGTGIKIDIPQQILCDLIKKYLPTCGDLTAVNLFETLIQAVCDLQVQVTANTASIVTINNQLTALESAYDIKCLTGVTSTSGTHNILQAVIDKLCAFIIDVQANYVKLVDLDALIAAYLASNAPMTQSAKMIPYTAVEYYGPIAGVFDTTGAGLVGTEWEKIYLCNGNNGTPDKRGVVPVGVNDGTMYGGPMSPLVDPAIAGNPTYSYPGTIQGSTNITLTTNQLPLHTHANTISVVAQPHTHQFTLGKDCKGSCGGIDVLSSNAGGVTGTQTYTTASTTVDITSSITNASAGGGLPHSNIQPSLGCYYIMYIP